jgi:hypothetical protein
MWATHVSLIPAGRGAKLAGLLCQRRIHRSHLISSFLLWSERTIFENGIIGTRRPANRGAGIDTFPNSVRLAIELAALEAQRVLDLARQPLSQRLLARQQSRDVVGLAAYGDPEPCLYPAESALDEGAQSPLARVCQCSSA